MWAVFLVLLSPTAAQLCAPPCGLFGEPLTGLAATFQPAAPSLQSWTTITVSGVSQTYSNNITTELSLERNNATFGFEQYPSQSVAVIEGEEFSYLLGVVMPDALIMKSGEYRYHIQVFGLYGPCMQEIWGSVVIGSTVSFSVNEFTWAPAAVVPGQPATLLIEGENDSNESISFTQCQVEILTNLSQNLSLVPCLVDNVQPGAPFQVTTEPMDVPGLEAGNYTVRVHFFAAEELGYVETVMPVTGASPLSATFYPGRFYIQLTNESPLPITITKVITYFLSTNSSFYPLVATINDQSAPQGGDYLAWVHLNDQADGTLFVEAANDRNITIGCFTFLVGQIYPLSFISNFSLTPHTFNSVDILLIYLSGQNLYGREYPILSTYGFESGTLTSTLNLSQNTYEIVSSQIGGVAMPSGKYLLTFNEPCCQYEVVEFVNNSTWVQSEVTFGNIAELVPGGCISINVSIEYDYKDYQCEVSLTNYSRTWDFGQLYCEVIGNIWPQQIYLPVMPLPLQLSPGPYIFIFQMTDTTWSTVTSVQATNYLAINSQVTSTSLSLFPTSIYTNDSLTVTLQGQATSNFTKLTLQSTAF